MSNDSEEGGLPPQITAESALDDEDPPAAGEIDLESVETSRNTSMDVHLGGPESCAEISTRPMLEPACDEAVELNIELGAARLNSALTYRQATDLIEQLQRALEISQYYRDSDEDPYADIRLDASHLSGGGSR